MLIVRTKFDPLTQERPMFIARQFPEAPHTVIHRLRGPLEEGSYLHAKTILKGVFVDACSFEFRHIPVGEQLEKQKILLRGIWYAGFAVFSHDSL